MLEIISNALGSIAGYFKWKSSAVAQRDAAESRVKGMERAERGRKAEVNKAVHEGDADAVNRMVVGIAVMWAVLFVAAVASVAGCMTGGVMYVAADREVTCTTNEQGMAVMWHVPPVVMEELLNSRLELEELKHQSKVKEITK